jgi:small GTP-binding protein
MIGAYSVGKTSLVERFVRSLYSDEYHTTIGVKIDKKLMSVDGEDVACMLWDIAGEDEFYTVNNNYLRGMSGYFLVVDGTRQSSIEIACRLQERVELLFPDIPFVVLVNKADLKHEQAFVEGGVLGISDRPYGQLHTSAKTGENVEAAFELLVREMVQSRELGLTHD